MQVTAARYCGLRLGRSSAPEMFMRTSKTFVFSFLALGRRRGFGSL